MTRDRGFTLMELLVVCAMISMLAMLVLPTLGQARELARRAKCVGNLKAVGNGLYTYATEFNRSRFPSFNSGQNTWNKVGYNKTTYTYDVQDGSRPLFMLMYTLEPIVESPSDPSDWERRRLDLVTPQAFVCPSVNSRWRRVDTMEHSSGSELQVGFESKESCNYSFQHSINPTGTTRIHTGLKGSQVVAGDRTPLVKHLTTAGQVGYSGGQPDADSYDDLPWDSKSSYTSASANHRGKGHNLLFIGGHARWSTETEFNGDNIWTPQISADDPSPMATDCRSSRPVSATDVFLVP